MAIWSAEAVLLDVFDLGERDRIVTFLTAEHGKKRGVARGSRAKFSRFAGQLQPLARVRVDWFEKPGRELVRINDVALLRPARLPNDLESLLLGSYLAEHMKEFAQEGEPAEKLFRLLDSTLDALAAGVDPALAARYYEIWMLRLSGIFPVPRECPLCGRELGGRAVLLDAEAALVCRRCAAGQSRLEVAPGELDFLRRSGRESLPELAARPPAPRDVARVEALCGHVRRHFLETELRSYRVMQETLAGLASDRSPPAPERGG